MIKPYYQDKWVTIYHGDCREILPQIGPAETIITDPVWPNALAQLAGSDDPAGLFQDFCQVIPVDLERMVIELGCDTDPRFLCAVPIWLPFIRACWLEYQVPSYKGRILYTGDVAYAFGRPPGSIEGRRVIAGKCTSVKQEKMFARKTGRNRTGRRPTAHYDDNLPHPTPRRLDHAKWLVRYFSDHQVIDPFMGSGTMAVACKEMNRQFIGIEIVEKYCDLAAKRCSQDVMDLRSGPPVLTK